MCANKMEDGTPPSQRPSETLIHQPTAEEEGLVENGSNSQSRPSDTVVRILGIVSGLTMTALVLSSAGLITGQNLLSQLFAAPPRVNPHQSAGQNEESFANGQLAPAFTEKATRTLAGSTASYSAVRPESESTSPHGPANTNALPSPDGEGLTPGQREASGPSAAGNPSRREPRASPRDTFPRPEVTSSTPRVASALSDETGAPPKVGADERASGGGPALSAAVRPAPRASLPSKQATSTLSPEAATDSTSATSESPLRAVLLQEPESRGWGNSYVVRLFNSAGQPMQVFGVLLVAHMADDSVEETAMGTLAEPGVYRGTVPTGRSTPVDLRVRVRVRVSNGERFVEIPVTR